MLSHERCKWCRFWDVEKRWGQDKDKAACRINPPTEYRQNETAQWPSTKAGDWCGKFEPRPE